MREDNREDAEMRPLVITRGYTKYAPGSVLIEYGDTKVICTASIEERVPPFMRDQGLGWVTAEYSLLPGASQERIRREVTKGKPSGRTNEIQRLIGRSLRAVLDMSKLGERTIYIDADVIQADGGTRTAAITGGMVALSDAVQFLLKSGKIQESPIREFIAAVSVGKVNGRIVSDLNYIEDSSAAVDMNVVMTESGKFVEVQGTAEKAPFSHDEFQAMIEVASSSISHIIERIHTTIK